MRAVNQSRVLAPVLADKPRAPFALPQALGEACDPWPQGGHPAAGLRPRSAAGTDRGAAQDPRGSASLGGVEGIVLGLGTAVGSCGGGSQLEASRLPAQTSTGHPNPRAGCPVWQQRVRSEDSRADSSPEQDQAGLSTHLPLRRAEPQIDPPRPWEPQLSRTAPLHGRWRHSATVQGKEGKGCRQGCAAHREAPR